MQGRRPIFQTKLPFKIVGNTFVLSRAHFYKSKRISMYFKNHQLCLRFYKCKGSVQKGGPETDLLVQISMTKSFHCWLIFYWCKYKNDFMGREDEFSLAIYSINLCWMPTETRDGSLVAMICSLEQRRLCGLLTHMNRELQYGRGDLLRRGQP